MSSSRRCTRLLAAPVDHTYASRSRIVGGRMANVEDISRRFDDVLRNLAGQAGSLQALLGVFFSFLHRNTDFYVAFDPSSTKNAKMGFARGTAEKLVLKAFHSFPLKPYDEQGVFHQRSRGKPNHTQEGSNRRPASSKGGGQGKPFRSTISTSQIPHARENMSTSSGATPEGVSESGNSPGTSLTMQQRRASQQDERRTGTKPNAKEPVGTPMHSSLADADGVQKAAGGIHVRYTPEGKQVPIGNGGVTPRYYWTQTINEATVYVGVSPGTRSKDVSCTIEPRRLKLVVNSPGDSNTPTPGAVATGVIVEGELPSAVSREESMWSLNDNKEVVISFEKASRSWWASVVKGDPEIDTTQVDSTTRIGEFDEETQGTIRKIMFDQRQKALGLPTSDELSADAIFEKAKFLPGSPFLPGGALAGASGDSEEGNDPK